MKFTWKTLKNGAFCFLFSPVLMAFIVILVHQERINGDTELYPWILDILNWRYSTDGFSFLLLMSILISFILSLIIKTQNIPRHEKIRLALILNFIGPFLSKMFLFWAGVFVAWTFGSFLIDFILPIPGQVVAIPLFVFLAVLSRLGFIKFKHLLIRS